MLMTAAEMTDLLNENEVFLNYWKNNLEEEVRNLNKLVQDKENLVTAINYRLLIIQQKRNDYGL